MKTWKFARRASLAALSLAFVGVNLVGGAPAARADNPQPHVVGALRDLREAKRHLDALPRSDKRDQAMELTQEAIAITEELGK